VRLQSPAAAALAAAALAAAVAGCGFDDKLTGRGFVKAGDLLCGEAIGRSFIAVQSTPGGASNLDAEGVATIARSYARIADGLRGLELREEDDAMRDEMVRRYSETAEQIGAAAGDPAGPVEVVVAIEELRPFAPELRDYGFRVCGGREPV
jgi:hypothetical protein